MYLALYQTVPFVIPLVFSLSFYIDWKAFVFQVHIMSHIKTLIRCFIFPFFLLKPYNFPPPPHPSIPSFPSSFLFIYIKFVEVSETKKWGVWTPTHNSSVSTNAWMIEVSRVIQLCSLTNGWKTNIEENKSADLQKNSWLGEYQDNCGLRVWTSHNSCVCLPVHGHIKVKDIKLSTFTVKRRYGLGWVRAPHFSSVNI